MLLFATAFALLGMLHRRKRIQERSEMPLAASARVAQLIPTRLLQMDAAMKIGLPWHALIGATGGGQNARGIASAGLILMSRLRARAAFVLMACAGFATLCASSAEAGVLTLNFPGDLSSNGVGCCNPSNTNADGFRISPNYHFDTIVSNGIDFIFYPAIAWDTSGSKSPD